MGEWYEDLRIESKTVKFQLDTGAKVNLVKLKSYSGHQVPTKGVFHVKFHVIEIEALWWPMAIN